MDKEDVRDIYIHTYIYAVKYNSAIKIKSYHLQ